MGEPDDFAWFADTFIVGQVYFLTIGWASIERGFQVAVRRTAADGWETYYGHDLKETCQRAVAHGPQLSPNKQAEEDDDWSHLV